jgi:delta24(24(1))-sterol reductase
MYYYWYCLEYSEGSLVIPFSYKESSALLQDMFSKITTAAMPTTETWIFYAAFFSLELLFAAFMPGPVVFGFPLEHEGGRKLPYLCNAFSSWISSIAIVLALHFGGIFPATWVIDNYPRLMSACVITGDVLSLVMYVGAHLTNNTFRMTGDHIYDFFMGASLNPRLANVDLKMFAEGRLSWILFFYINLSCTLKQYEELGYVTAPMIFLAIAQWLYANAGKCTMNIGTVC